MNVGLHPVYAVSTFSGIGALDVAVSRVFPASRVVAYLENEATAIQRLVARMEEGALAQAPIWTDVNTFRAADFARRLVHATGRGADLVYGGFPCQDLSLAGKRGGITAERSGLFFALIRAVRDLRPRYVFLENVAAIAVGRELDAVYGALAEIGFDALGSSLRAADVGAPHGRDRWWCLAWDREQLADANTPGLDIDGQQNGRAHGPDVGASRRSDAGGRSADVADPGRQSLAAGGCVGRDVRAEREAALRAGDAVADPECSGHDGRAPEPGRGPLGGTAAERAGGSRSGFPLWPPGPADRDGWAAILERWPYLAPATVGPVRRVAPVGERSSGLVVHLPCECNRSDRLRGLGNAVSVRCAETALRILWFRAFGVMP